ncbi:MAG: hypothetical protein LAO56_06260 [Acidobacteriia bacterium]|nr:hypothetical protein [Terriglobia bacterium]
MNSIFSFQLHSPVASLLNYWKKGQHDDFLSKEEIGDYGAVRTVWIAGIESVVTPSDNELEIGLTSRTHLISTSAESTHKTPFITNQRLFQGRRSSSNWFRIAA